MDSQSIDDLLPPCERIGLSTALQEKYFDNIHDTSWGTWVDIYALPSALRVAAYMRMGQKERERQVPRLYEEHLIQVQSVLQNITEYTLFVSKNEDHVPYFTAFLTFAQARKIGSMPIVRLMDSVEEDRVFQLLQRDHEQRAAHKPVLTAIGKNFAA